MCRRNEFTFTKTRVVLSQSYFRQCCHHKLVSSCSHALDSRHPCDSWLWDVPKIQTLAAQPRTAWALADVCILDHRAENERCFWLETCTAEICNVLLASVLGQVDAAVFQVRNVFIQRLPHHAQRFVLHMTTPALSVCLSHSP